MAVKVVQKPDEEVAAEVLASSIKKIADGLAGWTRGGMRQRALILLLNDVSKVSKTDIMYVLNSISALEREFCVPKVATPKK
jgi:hypothetical protein